MRVFVTGGTGFIGQAVIKRLLKNDWQVVALARSKKKAKTTGLKGLRWVFGDIRDDSWYQYVVGCEVFIHLVGVHGYKRMSYQERVAIELGGTQNAVTVAKQAGVVQFVHVGTAYDEMKTEYAKAKKLTKQWVKKQTSQGFPATIVCPATVYGPGDLVNFCRLFEAIKTNRFVFVGKGENTWRLIYIDDLVDFLIQILKNRKKSLGVVFILTGKRPIALKNLVKMIAKETGVPEPRIHLPQWLMFLAGGIFSFMAKVGLPGPFTLDTVRTMVSEQKGHSSKALKILGFKAKTDLALGIKQTARWYQKR